MIILIIQEILLKKYYMQLAQIKDLNALIDKPFFEQPVKNKQVH